MAIYFESENHRRERNQICAEVVCKSPRGHYFYSLKIVSFWKRLQNRRELAARCAICGSPKMFRGGGGGGEWHAGVPEMTSPAFPLPLFLLFSPQNQRCALRIAGGCSKPPMCWWSVAVSGVTPIFWVIFFLFSFFSLVFPVFLANLAGEERSAVARRCWEDENKGNFYW